MGVFIFIVVVVVGIIVFINVAKKIKRNKVIEEFKNGKKYEIALRVKEALEAKGGKFEEPNICTNWKYDHQVECRFFMSIPPSKKTCLRIFVSDYEFPVEDHKNYLLRLARGCFLVNKNGFVISSGEYADENYDSKMLEYMKTATDALIFSGCELGELYINGNLIEAP
jgi:hypothetical protein